MSNERTYTSRRVAIVNALVEKMKQINGSGEYQTNLEGRASGKLVFWDEISEFPSVYLSAGGETRDYQGGGYRDRYLNITVRCYVNSENSIDELEGLLEDVETVIEASSRLEYIDKNNVTQCTQQISITSLDTDEGVLAPLGVGEINCQVRY